MHIRKIQISYQIFLKIRIYDQNWCFESVCNLCAFSLNFSFWYSQFNYLLMDKYSLFVKYINQCWNKEKKNFWNHARFLSKVVVCLESWLLRKFWFGWFMRNGSTLCTSGCLGWAFKTLLLQRNAFFAHLHWIFTYSNFVSPIQSRKCLKVPKSIQKIFLRKK